MNTETVGQVSKQPEIHDNTDDIWYIWGFSFNLWGGLVTTRESKGQ